LLLVAVLLIGTRLVDAHQPQYYGGTGGTISGMIVGPGGNVLDWTQVNANNGNQTFEAFSGFSGFYLMRVPVGTYMVSVHDPYNPQYWAPNANVTVTNGSSSTVDFDLQQSSPSTVAEFQPNLSVLAVIVALAATCIATRRLKR
jgi:hypothetical protein